MTGKTTMQTQAQTQTVNELLDGREARYGSFGGHASIAQDLKAVLHGAPKWMLLNAVQKEALEMVCHKIARVLNGDPDYADNWTDIAGYAVLAERDTAERGAGRNG